MPGGKGHEDLRKIMHEVEILMEMVRIADSEERRQLAGFPIGWLDGFSKTCVARMTGNAVVPQVAYKIMEAIVAAEK